MYRIMRNVHMCGLSITVIGVVAAAALSGSCFFDTKTTLCEKTGLRCKPGQVCAADQGVCVDIGGCGDGVIGPEEMCDDGNILDKDGCRSDCKSDETCGNGILDEQKGETCDYGPRNGTLGSACSIDCVLTACGDGIVDLNEECDPGQTDSAGCNWNRNGPDVSHCKFSRCGDEYVNMAAEEECDDGKMPSSRCNSPILCKWSRCGDGFYNPLDGEQCDTGGDSQACNGGNTHNKNMDCHIPRCGDGYKNIEFTPVGGTVTEKCDDGNADDCGTCKALCADPAEPKKVIIITPPATSITANDQFTLKDDVSQEISFAYNSTQMNVVNIALVGNETADLVAKNTADKIKTQIALLNLKFTASANGSDVVIIATHLGPGKLTLGRSSMFSFGVIEVESNGFSCGSGTGCRVDMDCMSSCGMTGTCN